MIFSRALVINMIEDTGKGKTQSHDGMLGELLMHGLDTSAPLLV